MGSAVHVAGVITINHIHIALRKYKVDFISSLINHKHSVISDLTREIGM